MKLTDLDPRWLLHDGRRVGFIFKCPTDQHWYQSCMLEAFSRQEQWSLFEAAMQDHEDAREGVAHTLVQGCAQGMLWTMQPGCEFENMSVMPSIDGSAGGLWHGFITNGVMV